MTLSQRMRQVRLLRGLTQEELAQKTGIPASYISTMESGKALPAGNWEERIRIALNWTPKLDAVLDKMQQEA